MSDYLKRHDSQGKPFWFDPSERLWPPNMETSACGHISRKTVSVPIYPLATTWCEKCGHYVTVQVTPHEA